MRTGSFYHPAMATQIGHQSTHSFAADRRWPRFRLDVPVRVVAHRESKTLIVNGRGNEVSEGGLAIFVGRKPGFRERLGVESPPPYSSEPLRVPAVVRNRSGY